MIENNEKIIPEKRRNEILKLTSSEEILSVDILMDKFKTSRSTIIRDIKVLEYRGLVTKVFGGIRINEGPIYSFDSSSHEQIEEKRTIVRLAFELIKDHSTIVLNPGVTTLELAKLIVKSDLQISVITNSLKIINYLVINNFKNILSLGGDFYDTDYAFKGRIPIENIKFLDANTAFISVYGIDPKVGATLPFSEEADLVSVMLESAKERIIMVDHAKFGRISSYKVNFNIEDIDIIITDSYTDKSYIEEFTKKGVKVLIADIGKPL